MEDPGTVEKENLDENGSSKIKASTRKRALKSINEFIRKTTSFSRSCRQTLLLVVTVTLRLICCLYIIVDGKLCSYDLLIFAWNKGVFP